MSHDDTGAPTRQVGRSLTRLEARAKVTGRAEYIHNLVLPRMLYGKVARSTVAHGRQGQLGPTVVGTQFEAQHRHLIGKRITNRATDTRELGIGEVSANAQRSQHGRLLVMALVVDGDHQAERIEQIGLYALEDPMHQCHQLRVLAWLKVRRSHDQSRVATAATRSSPEMLSSVVIGPVAGTMRPSLVVAATANNARTAALSQ